jgi:hypothetical protein
MKVTRVDPVLAIQKERRGRKQEENAKTLIEKRREYFKRSLADSLKKGIHFDQNM